MVTIGRKTGAEFLNFSNTLDSQNAGSERFDSILNAQNRKKKKTNSNPENNSKLQSDVNASTHSGTDKTPVTSNPQRETQQKINDPIDALTGNISSNDQNFPGTITSQATQIPLGKMQSNTGSDTNIKIGKPFLQESNGNFGEGLSGITDNITTIVEDAVTSSLTTVNDAVTSSLATVEDAVTSSLATVDQAILNTNTNIGTIFSESSNGLSSVIPGAFGGATNNFIFDMTNLDNENFSQSFKVFHSLNNQLNTTVLTLGAFKENANQGDSQTRSVKETKLVFKGSLGQSAEYETTTRDEIIQIISK